MTPLRYVYLGRMGYRAATEIQERLRNRLLDGDEEGERLLLVEHPKVITLGSRACPANVLVSSAELSARGISIERTTRGGDVTYHGPGQLVAYAVMRLARGVLHHVEALAEAASQVAASVGVSARFLRNCPGVWVDDRKLAAIGVHVHRRVAIHGLALNVSTALSDFDLIIPCGLATARVTSLEVESRNTMSLPASALAFAATFAAIHRREAVASQLPVWAERTLGGRAPLHSPSPSVE